MPATRPTDQSTLAHIISASLDEKGLSIAAFIPSSQEMVNMKFVWEEVSDILAEFEASTNCLGYLENEWCWVEFGEGECEIKARYSPPTL
jgi:hypothetical protein